MLHSIRGGTATNMNNGGIDKDRTGHLNDSGLAPYLFHNGKNVLEEKELLLNGKKPKIEKVEKKKPKE